MYVLLGSNIKKCTIVKKYKYTSIVIIDNNKETIQNDNLFTDIQKARLAKKEFIKIKKFKKKHKDKNGMLKCHSCGKMHSNLTVDHIKSLKSFGGRDKIRESRSIWDKAWNEENLQILCESCNKIKKSMSKKKFDKYINNVDKISNQINNKKNRLVSKGIDNKVSYKINSKKVKNIISDVNTDYSEVLMRIARKDSRLIFCK